MTLVLSSHYLLHLYHAWLFFLFAHIKGWYSGLVALCCKVEASPLLESPFRLPEINVCNAMIFMAQWQEGV